MKKTIRAFLMMSVIVLLMMASCEDDVIQKQISGKPPVAMAGSDITIYIPQQSVTLDGTASHGLESYIVSYLWLQISGTPILNVNPNYERRLLLEQLQEGMYEFELKVTDSKGLLARDTVKLTVIDEFALNKTPLGLFNCDNMVIAITSPSAFINASVYVENDLGIRYYFSKGVSVNQLSGPTLATVEPLQKMSGTIGVPIMNLSRGKYSFKLEAERNGLKAYDTITIQVIDDTLFGKEYVFETIWEKDKSNNSLFGKTPAHPDLFFYNEYRKTQIWIKTEGSSDWHEVTMGAWDYDDWCYSSLDECNSALKINTINGFSDPILSKKLWIRVKYTK